MLTRLILLALLTVSPAAADTFTGPATVIDGDTIRMGEHRIRLSGFDAPERDQHCGTTACGAVAAEELRKHVADQPITCVPDGTRHGNRIIATCHTPDGQTLGDWMVSEGYAVDDARYAPNYAPQTAAARAADKGLWPHGLASGRAWRIGAVDTADINPAECAIKGNISANGRIYHVPGESRSYGATRIDLSRGERWFCSVAEAEAAGWRAPGAPTS
ncbi:thermonuclease family protein [Pontivivens ytuae]|uniref:Thermonuclease family protein n=1 Tax=Pontivivens ytuae TaxID=2789856 RepID=A0A7S9QC02_9RHOB|nr:thermonuclease family protein [Pontivivens ytuae]QPH52882.1 thermonuclease family protein [Pontivivens ytuae]